MLGEDDLEQSWQLGRLAFGVGPEVAAPTWPRPFTALGVRDARGRLLAKASLQDYAQWWGGRQVPMGGVAGVAVHPDARGQGLASLLVRELLAVMAGRGQAVSALYPTVVGLYRSLGWEVVGTLDETVLRTGDLAAAGQHAPPSGVVVRTADPGDAAALTEVYDAYARDGSGLLTRTGPMFTGGPAGADTDLTAVAVDAAGKVQGCLRYDRGRGYRGEAELSVRELLAASPGAFAALLQALGGWHPVAPRTRWRGSTAALGLLLPAAVPSPERRQPWMLRIVDPPAAVAARGWTADCDVAFRLVDEAGPRATPGDVGRSWRLVVRSGQGSLEPGPAGGPVLHERGLALLYSGAADTAAVRRAGLLDGSLPGLDAALAGPRPELLDYF